MKRFLTTFCLLITTIITMSSYSLSKYYSSTSKIVWKTQFTSFTNVETKDVNTFIVGKSSDNENSLSDGDANFSTTEGGGSTSKRWTNWYSDNQARGKEAEIHLIFAKTVNISIMRLYHFVDYDGVDMPKSVAVSYIDANGETKQIVSSSLENMTRNFDVASDRTSIYRTYSTSNISPKYNIEGQDYEFLYGNTVKAPYTEVDFNETITTNTIIIKLQANDNWYLGLIEIAMDWIFEDGTKQSSWYGKL